MTLKNAAAGVRHGGGKSVLIGDPRMPAARPDVIMTSNVDRLDCKLIVQGANMPITTEAEDALHEKGILSIPDFIAMPVE